MAGALVPRVRDDIERLGAHGLTWVDYSAAVAEVLETIIPFQAHCNHTVDPGTILFTGSVNRNVGCSGSWLAHHEYVIEDVNKWSFLANSGRLAGASSIETHGELSRSARHRSHESFGFGDELRVSLVADGIYWGASAFLRAADEPWFTEAEVQALVALAPLIATGLRRALLAQPISPYVVGPVDHGPGVVVFDENGEPESISGAAERWISELIEEPPPARRASRRRCRRSPPALAPSHRAPTPSSWRPEPGSVPARARGSCSTAPGSVATTVDGPR